MYGPDPCRRTARPSAGPLQQLGRCPFHPLRDDPGQHAGRPAPDNTTVDLGPGTIADLKKRAQGDDATGKLLGKLLAFRTQHQDLIARDFPPHWRRATGYSLNEFLKPDDVFNPARLLASGEGTLGTLLQVTLDLVPIPPKTGLVMLQFDNPAMEATPQILEVEPSAIELMDRMLIDLTRQQPGTRSRSP